MNRPGGGYRPGGIGNNTHIGDNNFQNINNNFINNNNINIATNRPYYNNWQHGNWNGNWNGSGGSRYWNRYGNGDWNRGWGGYWHGGGYGMYGGYWGSSPWYAAPITWGLGTWAVGSIAYNSGYSLYSNPYYVSSGSTAAYYDYSQPITVINQHAAQSAAATAEASSTTAAYSAESANEPPPPSPEVQQATSHLDLARSSFRAEDYPTALKEVDVAIKSLPQDAALHEFRALVLFATKDYQQAAAALYAVLSAGPGWNWTTLSGMYASTATYTAQLQTLEQTVRSTPSSAEARFVLAYHYLVCGHNEEAIHQYREVLKLQPNNQLASQLVKMLGGDTPTSDPAATPEPPEAEVAPVAPPPIDSAAIVGGWNASRSDGAKFSLRLTNDSKFTWTFQQGTKREEFGGTYSVDGAVLVLERTDGAQMPGLVTMNDGGFNYKLYGGPPEDTGLDFRK
ncbi:MAG TPA: tetratricopeptide repeat protein [Caulifigura sp.]|nr:tetratricopeptide repeat protein [Caulifigura sp.]